MIAMDNLQVNDNVIIKLKDGDSYKGTIAKIGENCRFIELGNVYDCHQNENIPGHQRFYHTEIESAEQINNKNKDETLKTKSKDLKAVTKSIPSNEAKNTEQIVETQSNDLNGVLEYGPLHEIRKTETKLIQEKVIGAILIQQTDQRYHRALDEIRAQEFVGFSMEGTKYGRLQNASLMSFSTENNIFIFDIVKFGEIFSEIKAILEAAEKPIKIVFDSRYVHDNLLHVHKCELKGILDLMVLHFAIVKEKTPITLLQCIQLYFISYVKLPADLHPNEWRKRPLTDQLLHNTACNVAFLRKLHAIMSRILLKPLKQQSEIFSGSISQNLDLVDTFHAIATGNGNGFTEVDTDCLDDLNNFSLGDTN